MGCVSAVARCYVASQFCGTSVKQSHPSSPLPPSSLARRARRRYAEELRSGNEASLGQTIADWIERQRHGLTMNESEILRALKALRMTVYNLRLVRNFEVNLNEQ